MVTTGNPYQFDAIVARLASLHPCLERAEIRHIVARAERHFPKARLGPFAPLLVENAARDACGGLAGPEPPRQHPASHPPVA